MNILKTAIATALLAASSASMATPITVGAGWYGFCFNGVGDGAFAGCQNDGVGIAGNTMTFNVASAAWLQVTDAFLFGDKFDVFVDGLLVFTTGGGTYTGGTTTNPDVAYSGGAYDTGSFLIGAGNHTVDIFVDTTVGGGGAYVQLLEQVGVVPNPGTLSLVGLGLLAGLQAARRRKQG